MTEWKKQKTRRNERNELSTVADAFQAKKIISTFAASLM